MKLLICSEVPCSTFALNSSQGPMTPRKNNNFVAIPTDNN